MEKSPSHITRSAAAITAMGAVLLAGGCSQESENTAATNTFELAIECPTGFTPRGPQVEQIAKHKFEVDFACLSETNNPATRPPVNVRQINESKLKPGEDRIVIHDEVYDKGGKNEIKPSADYIGSWVIVNAIKIKRPIELYLN